MAVPDPAGATADTIDRIPVRAASLLRPAAGAVLTLGAWWLLSALLSGPHSALPSPWAVLRRFLADGWSFYAPNVAATASEAVQGYLWGNIVAIAVALAVLLLPWLERPATLLAVVSYCVPVMAIGPLLTIVFTGRTPMVALSALAVFFTTLLGALSGLRSADRSSLDLVRAYGGGRWQQLRLVRVMAALPAVFSALQLAAPAAFLGALIGEWLGNLDTGLGVAMVISMQQLDTARTWAMALLSAALAGIGYALPALAARWVLPWAATTRQGHSR